MTAAVDRIVRGTRCAVALLPRGRTLPAEVWQRRHRAIVRLAVTQSVALLVFGLGRHLSLPVSLAGALLVLAPVACALPGGFSRKVRSAAACTSLFAASVVLVQFWGGQTEAHFHFFVMVGVVALYQDWVPFGIGLGVVVLHHGVLGTLAPRAVFGHEMHAADPWRWMLLHAGFVLAASVAHLAAWRLNEQQGLHDPLTGLANRTMLVESLTRALARRDVVSVVFVDLDDFKHVNDSRGHAAGDQLLLAVADRLRGSVRRTDLVARLGGDEFAVLVAGTADGARVVGERFLADLAVPVDLDGEPVLVHASLGVADVTTTDPTTSGLSGPAELVRNADTAMYWAKATGKNRLVVHAVGMSQAAHGKATLTEDLAHALERDELALDLQPRVDTRDEHVVGHEVLPRWHHPRRGVFTAEEFLPLAESSGYGVAVGEWVLRSATARAAVLGREQGAPLTITVPLSAALLAAADLDDVVLAALRDSGLPPERLTLEVRENVLLGDLVGASSRLRAVRRTGVRIGVDAIGSVAPNLSYLRGLPIDVVTVGRAFVLDVDRGGAAAVLVSGIVELGRSLGLDVVARGVETEFQARALRELSCPFAQGSFYSRATVVLPTAA